jgi:hypothetical protein
VGAAVLDAIGFLPESGAADRHIDWDGGAGTRTCRFGSPAAANCCDRCTVTSNSAGLRDFRFSPYASQTSAMS